jgi:hypothetical protein
MAKKVSRNAPCPCGSGKKYKQCCLRKDFDWVQLEDGSVARSLPMSDEMMSLAEVLRQSYRAKHGRDPERLFEGAPPLELIEHWTVEAMKKSEIDPALIYAYEKTNGLLLSARTENKVPDSDIAEWEAAIDEYERKTGKKATRRRLNDQDLDAMLQDGPREPAPPNFVERLSITPQFGKEEWEKLQLTDVVKNPRYFDYFQRCLEEVKSSGRAEIYLDLFSVMALGVETRDANTDYAALLREARERHFSVEELEVGLETMVLSCAPQQAIPSAAAAFEFLGFLGEFISTYAEHLGAEDQLEESLGKVHQLALLAFGAAVNAELGIRKDIWKPSA